MSRRVLVCCLLLLLVVADEALAQRRQAVRGRSRGRQEAAEAGGDDVDVNALLTSDRALTDLVRCLLARGDGPCSPKDKAVKALVTSGVETNCGSCSEKQRQAAEKVVRHLTTSRRKDWNKLVARYDPTGELRSKHRAYYEQRGVKL